MRPSLRFLGLALAGWIGVRAAMLGAIPGADFFTLRQGAAASATPSAALVPTEFPPIEPLAPADPEAAAMMQAAMPAPLAGAPESAQPAYYYSPAPQPAYWAPRAARNRSAPPFVQASAPYFYAPYSTAPPYPTAEEYPTVQMAAAAAPPLSATPTFPGRSVPEAMKGQAIDRLQLTAWAMLRGRAGQRSAPAALANGGTLGASQAGARLTYNFTRQLAASLRTTSVVGKRGGEVALGARVQPVRGIPVWATAERRFALGRYGGGRNAFALFFEGGLWNKRLPMNFRLDAYLQGGVVGFKRRDAFIDGAMTATRPVYRNYSAGVGIWGAAQPGVSRLDAGPRVTMKVRPNLNVHLDYRQRLAGNAEPGSGPVVTLAGDF